MPSTQTKQRRPAGFTLIEMLVIAPLVIILIGVLIGYITSLTGQGLQLRERNALAYTTQAALDDMELVGSRATSYLSTTGTLASPQGKSDSTTAFTNTTASSPDTLIMRSVSTDKSAYDPTRQIIYSGTGACNPNNAIYTYTTVYFVTSGDLYKRTITTPSAACAVPYQKNSCSPTIMTQVTPPSNCKVMDEKLATNITAFSIAYYTGTTSVSASDPSAADNVVITLTASRLSAGDTLAYTGTLRISTVNAQVDTAGQTNGSAPQVTATGPSSNTPDSYSCQWDPTGNASSYTADYSTNGGSSWTTASLAPGTTTFSLDVSNLRGGSVRCRVTATIPSGTLSYGTVDTSIPLWTDCSLQNGWVNYGGTHATAQFTKTSTGLILLKGLIKSGNTANYTIVCQLPEGYRPDSKQIFTGFTGGTSIARIEIDAYGQVSLVGGNASWTNLSGAAFMPAGSVTWTPLTAYNGWTNKGTPWSDVKVAKDSSGRAILQGVPDSGSMTSGYMAYALPASYSSSPDNIYLTHGGGVTTPAPFNLSGTRIETRGVGSNVYWPLFHMFYPNGSTTWTNASLQNSWVNFGSTYATPSYAKNSVDNVVSLQGMTKNGNSSSGARLFYLPVGYRPSEIIICGVTTSGSTNARIDVYPDGSVYVREGVSSTWLSLAGCNFLAEQ